MTIYITFCYRHGFNDVRILDVFSREEDAQDYVNEHYINSLDSKLHYDFAIREVHEDTTKAYYYECLHCNGRKNAR